jgi:hypothetical protein
LDIDARVGESTDGRIPDITLPVADVVGWKAEGDKVQIGMSQPNGVIVGLELSEESLVATITQMMDARRAFAPPGIITNEPAIRLQSIMTGINLGKPESVFLRLVLESGSHLGISISNDVARKLISDLQDRLDGKPIAF